MISTPTQTVSRTYWGLLIEKGKEFRNKACRQRCAGNTQDRSRHSRLRDRHGRRYYSDRGGHLGRAQFRKGMLRRSGGDSQDQVEGPCKLASCGFGFGAGTRYSGNRFARCFKGEKKIGASHERRFVPRTRKTHSARVHKKGVHRARHGGSG